MFFARQGYFLLYVFFFCRQHARMQLHVSNFLFPTHRCVSVCACRQRGRLSKRRLTVVVQHGGFVES